MQRALKYVQYFGSMVRGVSVCNELSKFCGRIWRWVFAFEAVGTRCSGIYPVVRNLKSQLEATGILQIAKTSHAHTSRAIAFAPYSLPVPARRGGSCLRVAVTIRPFSELVCAVCQPGPCVLCANLLHCCCPRT